MEEYRMADKDKLNSLITSIRIADKKYFSEGDLEEIVLYHDEIPGAVAAFVRLENGEEYELVGKENKGRKHLIIKNGNRIGTDLAWLVQEFLHHEDVGLGDEYYSVLREGRL